MAAVRLTKGELAYRSDFIDVLRDVIRPQNLDVKDEIRITLYGSKEKVLIPDLLILERGKYEEQDDVLIIRPEGLKAIIETKHPRQYSTVGFARLIEYCGALTHDLGFVTNFKELVEYRVGKQGQPSITPQTFGSSVNQDTSKNIAEFILKEIQTPTPELMEISDESLLKLLHNSLDDIQNELVGDVSNIADALGIFKISYDRELFKPEERQKPQLQELIRRAASFVILNQIVFYIALAHNTRLVGQIKKLSSLDELQSYFDHISTAIDYKAVFGARVVSFLPHTALDTVNGLISNLEALHFYSIKREILGKIYHSLIPKEIRKRIAAYYTSNTACELLARLTIQKANAKVLDPSCGSGGFLVAAYNVKKELSPTLTHKDLIESLYGFDISLFASHLSVINLTLQDLHDVTNEVYVTVDDAFNQHSSETIEVLWSPPSEKRVATTEGIKSKKVVLPSVDVVLMNPPFTRIERLEDDYEDYLIGKHGIFKRFANFVEGQSGLHCFFLLHIRQFLRDGSRFGAVLPAATFSSEYGLKLKPFILENYRILYFITYESQSTFSVDCDFKEILLVATKGRKEAASAWKAKVIVLKEDLKLEEIESLANQFQRIEHEVDSSKYSVRIVNKRDFEKERNWMTFTRAQSLRQFILELQKSGSTSNQEEIIQFHEGFHLDAPYFFRLPNEYWSIKQDGDAFLTLSQTATKRELNIPRRYLTPTLDVPDKHRTISTHMHSYILNISEPEQDIPPDVRDYISWGETFKKPDESKSIPELFKIANYSKTGRRWYTYGNHIIYREDPSTHNKVLIGSHLAIVEKFRTKTRECIVLFSPDGLTGSNSYFFGVLQPEKGMERFRGDSKKSQQNILEAEKLLAAWFSSTLFLALYLYYRREISGDYGRIKIGDMTSFPCINPSKVAEEDKVAILREFEAIKSKQLPTIFDQLKTRTLWRMDLALLRALGIDESTELLEKLYADLLAELNKTEVEEESPSTRT
jgi:type I restriction-modification system DNA methylase subunit